MWVVNYCTVKISPLWGLMYNDVTMELVPISQLYQWISSLFMYFYYFKGVLIEFVVPIRPHHCVLVNAAAGWSLLCMCA